MIFCPTVPFTPCPNARMSTQRYLVTARKYRPNLFLELVAQEHVTETLKNALRLDRLAHAYLFSGPRGVGKTTAARILAKAINCTTPPDERSDPAEPCRQCGSCQDFESARSLNIFEIDAASNNKVEDIRDLRETVRIPPQGSRKKVYIIDEVHMLSNAAFNALLKTLEEPPPHVLFIFATTEPHKVLPTILSRCQRFDFRRIPVPDIVAHLKEICEQETITADEASLMLLARKGDGALRDALSAFDQAVSLCGTDLRYTELADALRVVDVDLFFEVTRHVAEHNSPGMLHLVEHIVRSGYDLQEFLVGLAEHLRNLLVALTMDDAGLIEAAEATRLRYTETARAFTEADLLRLLMIADEAEESIKSSTHPRMKLEIALLKMAGLTHAADLRQVLLQLDRLETLAREGKLAPGLFAPAETLQRNAKPPEKPAPASARRAPPAPQPAPPAAAEPPEETAQPEPADATPEGIEEEVEAESTAPDDDVSEPSEAPLILPEAEEKVPAAPHHPPAPSTEEKEATPPAAPSNYPTLFGTPPLQKKTPRNAAADASVDLLEQPERAGVVATMNAVAVASTPALQRMASAWSRYVQTIKDERIHVGALLQHTVPLDVAAQTVTVGVPDAFHQRLLNNQHDYLVKHLQALDLEKVDRLAFTVCEALEADPEAAGAPTVDPQEYLQRKRQENPVIRAIFEQFGGEVVW